MNKIRPIILAVAVIVAALLAYGLFTLPSPKGLDEEGFSAARVVKDIEVISKEHHSVAHPQERAEVREYMKKMAAERGLMKPNGNIDDGPFLRSLTKEERATLKKMFDEIED